MIVSSFAIRYNLALFEEEQCLYIDSPQISFYKRGLIGIRTPNVLNYAEPVLPFNCNQRLVVYRIEARLFLNSILTIVTYLYGSVQVIDNIP